MKTSTERFIEMQRNATSGEFIVKRLCAEFGESFWQQGQRVMESYRDTRGAPAVRCVGEMA